MMAWLRLGRGTLRRDLAIAAGFLVGGLLLLALGTYSTVHPGLDTSPGVFSLTLLATCVAVALRRVATRTSLALGSVAAVVDLALGGSLATILVYTQVLFDACVYGPARMWRWLLRVFLVLTGIVALAGVALVRSWQGLVLGVLVLLIGVLPVVTGISVRQYRDQAATERARAEQLARLAELDRRQAITAERTRMARELHDIVANHLSAVAIHATAVLSVPNLDRAQVTEALRVIRENSVQGLAEMRQMIRLLREPAEPTTAGEAAPAGPGAAGTRRNGVVPSDPAITSTAAGGITDGLIGGDEALRPRLTELDRLVARSRDVGLPVRLETVGEFRSLPASVDLAAYRIVQEALTNALKHGAGPADVRVAFLPDRVCITVENPLPGPVTGQRLPGSGSGLVGMRERAVLLHGRFDAGPHGRCWRVYAELPTTEVDE